MRDIDVRIAVRGRLASEHEGDADTRIVEEMGIWNGAVRVDLAVINGELAGYEIKSARDTLQRLPAQAALYNAVFDRVHLVAAEKHLPRATAEIPSWWGVIVAHDDGDRVRLVVERAGDTNPAIEPAQIARLLWRDEAIDILESHGAARGVRGASRERVVERLVSTLGLNELRQAVRQCLKRRQQWLGQPVNDQADVAIGREG
ncbi:sce7726 family protein [Sphingomonas sp.]|uniref:sce7726 family protein n=1 Tax=Sphingomonas sp. TaxID=28214 RepID=UPI0035C7DC15